MRGMFDYRDLFLYTVQLDKFIMLTEILDPPKTDNYQWVLGDSTDGITLASVRFRYQRVSSLSKYVDIFYNLASDKFIITNAVTGASVTTDEPDKAAAVAISYADSFAALR